MGLYKLFSTNVEIQYKSSFLSKAMLFTLITTIVNIVLPFILAYRSRGFWLKSHSFYEQPKVHFTYDYLLIAESEDPSQPIVCSEATSIADKNYNGAACAEIQVQENDYNRDGRNDVLQIQFQLNIPPHRTISSLILILSLDFQMNTICPLHMQSLAIINRDFPLPPSGLKYFGDLSFYQIEHLPCQINQINTKYNSSLLKITPVNSDNSVTDYIMENYFSRKVSTHVKTIYSKSQNGHTGTMDLKVHLRVPEMKVNYVPSMLQELKWALPQYLSLVVIFYWVFNQIKKFVFNNRLLMAWKVVPWKKN